jgi:hypothetical protein
VENSTFLIISVAQNKGPQVNRFSNQSSMLFAIKKTDSSWSNGSPLLLRFQRLEKISIILFESEEHSIKYVLVHKG